jgi:hypothetical protein
MKKHPSQALRSVKSGQFVLTSSHGEKISAIEGMTLTPRMEHVLKDSARRGLSGDERRALIKDIIGKK